MPTLCLSVTNISQKSIGIRNGVMPKKPKNKFFQTFLSQFLISAGWRQGEMFQIYQGQGVGKGQTPSFIIMKQKKKECYAQSINEPGSQSKKMIDIYIMSPDSSLSASLKRKVNEICFYILGIIPRPRTIAPAIPPRTLAPKPTNCRPSQAL